MESDVPHTPALVTGRPEEVVARLVPPKVFVASGQVARQARSSTVGPQSPAQAMMPMANA